jgi:hypothetical protein
MLPYGYAYNDPVMQDDPLGLRVRVCCKIIPFTFGHRHCLFEFDSGPPHKTVSLHFHDEGNPLEIAFSVVGLQTAERDWDNGFDLDPADQKCGPWNNCGDACVTREAESYGVRRYTLLGTNSNTFAAYITWTCGLTPPGPEVTDDAPSWYKPYPPVPYVPWSEVQKMYNQVPHSP